MDAFVTTNDIGHLAAGKANRDGKETDQWGEKFFHFSSQSHMAPVVYIDVLSKKSSVD